MFCLPTVKFRMPNQGQLDVIGRLISPRLAPRSSIPAPRPIRAVFTNLATRVFRVTNDNLSRGRETESRRLEVDGGGGGRFGATGGRK